MLIINEAAGRREGETENRRWTFHIRDLDGVQERQELRLHFENFCIEVGVGDFHRSIQREPFLADFKRFRGGEHERALDLRSRDNDMGDRRSCDHSSLMDNDFLWKLLLLLHHYGLLHEHGLLHDILLLGLPVRLHHAYCG